MHFLADLDGGLIRIHRLVRRHHGRFDAFARMHHGVTKGAGIRGLPQLLAHSSDCAADRCLLCVVVENDELVAAFKELREKYPTSSLEGIFAEIAKKSDLTTAAIRAICKKRGGC